MAIDLAPTIGAEIQKTRPAVIVNNDAVGILPLKVIVPITDWKPHYVQAPWMVRVDPNLDNGLTKTSAADAFQVRSLSEMRFVRRCGTIGPDEMTKIETALRAVLNL